MNNILDTLSPDLKNVHCPVVEGRETIEERYSQYLKDESRLEGEMVQRIYFPRSTEEVIQAVKEIGERNENVTISGGRTGVVGGAVPLACENLISLESIKPVIRLSFHEKDN